MSTTHTFCGLTEKKRKKTCHCNSRAHFDKMRRLKRLCVKVQTLEIFLLIFWSFSELVRKVTALTETGIRCKRIRFCALITEVFLYKIFRLLAFVINCSCCSFVDHFSASEPNRWFYHYLFLPVLDAFCLSNGSVSEIPQACDQHRALNKTTNCEWN